MEVTKEPDLIDGWWTSDGLYQLERRAVFCKANWHFKLSSASITNTNRPGSVSRTVAASPHQATTFPST
jgi:hypothetical protein